MKSTLILYKGKKWEYRWRELKHICCIGSLHPDGRKGVAFMDS
jgi:hypothetical protein